MLSKSVPFQNAWHTLNNMYSGVGSVKDRIRPGL
jgi:hypothetical protein